VKIRWADAGGGDGRVEAQTTTSVKTVKKQGVVNNKKDINIFGVMMSSSGVCYERY
jgi:hypothetical protein